jgi:anti-anti-sigma factor
MMPQFNAALVPSPDQVVVRLVGDTDLSTAPQVTEVLTRAAGLNTRQIVVDVAGARFWDCSGLHALAGFTRELSAAGRACRIVGALPATRRLIGMANLAGRLQLDGVPAAIAADPSAAGGMHTAEVPTGLAASRHPVPVRGAVVVAALGR